MARRRLMVSLDPQLVDWLDAQVVPDKLSRSDVVEEHLQFCQSSGRLVEMAQSRQQKTHSENNS